MDLGIRKKVAFVSGGTRGIGLAIARALSDEGATVVVAGRDLERSRVIADEIGGHGFQLDTAKRGEAEKVLEEVASTVGVIEILVTNTGGPPAGSDAVGFSVEEWEDAYRNLVLAPMAMVKHVLPGMRQRGWGRVVNVSSSTTREPAPNLMLSNTHRSATLAAFKTIARQVAAEGITLNSVLPGRIETERLIELYGSQEKAEAMARDEIPAGRLGTREEFAAVAAFLCSQQAAYVTGAALLVDGGLTKSI